MVNFGISLMRTKGDFLHELNILTIGDYVKIGNYLKTIVTSYLLSDLGINNIIIEKYQAQTIQE